LCAKNFERPIVAVDCLEEFEDRRFPFAANIPGVHMDVENSMEPSQRDMLRILSAVLLETVRFHYSKRAIDEYKRSGWISEKANVLSRPPEIPDIDQVVNSDPENRIKWPFDIEFVYPEPPIYDEELAFLKSIGVKAHTPLNYELFVSLKKKVGISISNPSQEELSLIGHSEAHLKLLSQDIARYLLAKSATLIYGGDLRKDGFTEFIFKEAQALKARLQTDDIHLKNYIAWPIYKKDSNESIEWKAKYAPIATMVESRPPSDVLDIIPDIDTFLPPSNLQNQFIWSRCLTEIRKQMIRDCDVRICAGGKQAGYKGLMPGVLEEILIALKENKPIFLLGGFGGITANVCRFLQSNHIPVELTLDWQVSHNYGYENLLEYYTKNNESYKVDYEAIKRTLKKAKLNNGLSAEDNERLFKTQFIDEALYLIFKGLKKLARDR
jgi:hypothetical protein